MSTGLTLQDRLESSTVRALAALPSAVLRRLVGRPIERDGQQLRPEIQLLLKLMELDRAPKFRELPVAEARAQAVHDARTLRGPVIRLSEVRELEVAGATGAIPGRLYVPDAAYRRGPLTMYLHGGGFVVGDLDTHDNTCRLLAERSGSRVLAIDYRRAPEYPFPAPLEDAVAAFRFTVEHCAEMGADPTAIAVAGDSAGGNMAVGVAQACHADGGPAPVFQLLFYPWLDLAEKRDSYRLFGDGFYLTEADLDWYRDHYVGRDEDALDPRCSPLRAGDLSGLPPAYIATAGFDPLRDEGEEYAGRLRAAGVPVALRRHEGLIHAFINLLTIGRVAREGVVEAAGALRLALATSP